MGLKALQGGVSGLTSFFSVVKYPIVGYSLGEKEMNGAMIQSVTVKLSPGTSAPVALMLCVNKYGVSTAHVAWTSTRHGSPSLLE